MNKQEFLRILKESLAMSVDQSAISEQVDYYDKYISDEISKGRTEKEVIDELGDPRLIAKTIKTVNTSATANKEKSSKDDYDDNYDNYEDDDLNYNKRRQSNKYATVENTNVIGCAIAFLVGFIILYSILKALGYLAYGVGSFAFSGPFGFLIVFGLLWLFFGGRRR